MMKSATARPQIVLLVVVNALLLLVMGYEVMGRPQQEVFPDNNDAAPLEQVEAPAEKMAPTQRVEDFEEIVRRPLFNRERRPIEKAATDAADDTQADAFTLVGVVLTPEQQVAIIYSKTQKQPVKVALWEWIEGWRLVSVQASVVELRKGKRSLELALQRTSGSSVEAKK